MSVINNLVAHLQQQCPTISYIGTKPIPDLEEITLPSIFLRLISTVSEESEFANCASQLKTLRFGLVIYAEPSESDLETLLENTIARAMRGYQATQLHNPFWHVKGNRSETTPNLIVWSEIWATSITERQT